MYKKSYKGGKKYMVESTDVELSPKEKIFLSDIEFSNDFIEELLETSEDVEEYF